MAFQIFYQYNKFYDKQKKHDKENQYICEKMKKKQLCQEIIILLQKSFTSSDSAKYTVGNKIK